MSKRVVELTAEELDKLACDAWGTAAREALAQGHSVTGSRDGMRVSYHPDGTVTELGPIAPMASDHPQSLIQIGDLVINLDVKTVEVAGQRVHLTGKEYQILEILSLRKGAPLSRDVLLHELYGGEDEPELKIIDVLIAKLRKKLASSSPGKNYIEAIWKHSYTLCDPDDEAIKKSTGKGAA